MNELKIFEKAEFGSVRVVMKDGEPWFVARDVAQALGYVDPADAVRRHCEKVNKITQQGGTPGSVNTPPVSLLIIPEEDVYALIFGSELPSAKAFRRWLCDEVIPSIRRTGQYGGYALPRIPQSFSDALRMIADIEEEKALALEQRDYYRRTKAEIGSRREATAMNTASRLSKENARLHDALGDGRTWKQAKAIEWIADYFIPSPGMWSQLGKKLSALSAEMGYAVKRKESSEYPNGVGLYHASVITRLRARLDAYPEMLGKYRRGRVSPEAMA